MRRATLGDSSTSRRAPRNAVLACVSSTFFLCVANACGVCERCDIASDDVVLSDSRFAPPLGASALASLAHSRSAYARNDSLANPGPATTKHFTFSKSTCLNTASNVFLWNVRNAFSYPNPAAPVLRGMDFSTFAR